MPKLKLPELALALATLLLTLVVAELAIRVVRDPVAFMRPTPIRPTTESAGVWRNLIHRRSAVPGLAYELKPNRNRYGHGALVRTNSFGMRDSEPRPEEDDVFRVVALGDSFTFGFGVSGHETWPNVLERLLKEGSGSDRYEVLNFGVGGYSTRDEALTLQHKAMRWRPELIVLGYTLNDPEIDPIQPLHRHFTAPQWWQHSELLRLVALRKYLWEVQRLGKGDYYRYLHAEPRKWASVVEGFATIGSVARQHGIPALVVLFPETLRGWPEYPYADLHRQVESVASEAGLHVLDLVDSFSAYSADDLAISSRDDHPSVLAHQLAAKAIAPWMARHLSIPSE